MCVEYKNITITVELMEKLKKQEAPSARVW